MSGSIVTISTRNVSEGSGYPGTLIASIKTVGLSPGTTLYYRFIGSGITDEDFSLGGIWGSSKAQGWLNIGADGWGYINHTIGADRKTEGDETAKIEIALNSDFSSLISDSSSFIIQDTSTGPYYTISVPSEIVEGQNLAVTVKTKSLTGDLNPSRAGNQQYLAWKITGAGFDSTDLDGSYPLDGGGVSVNREGDDEVALSIPIKKDGKTEGVEQWKLTLYSRMEASPSYEVASATFNVKDFASSTSMPSSSITMTGFYQVSYGTDSRDVKTGLTSGNAYFAKGGNDYISTNGKTYLSYEGKNWWIPSLVSGGDGNDEYSVGPGAAVVIADASSSSGDSLRIFDYITNVTDLFSIENRHVYIGTSWGTSIVLVDALNGNGAIESIAFSDIALSAIPASARSLVATYQTRGNQSLRNLESEGLFNPKVMGISSSDVQGLIDSLYQVKFGVTSNPVDIANQFIDAFSQSSQSVVASAGSSLVVSTSSWSDTIQLKTVAKASNSGSRIDSDQVDFTGTPQGSILLGGTGNDQLWGKAGWDIIDGGAGNDLVRAGNGRDIITGALGADELHGDFGWNTYKSEKDGYRDLIAIKSDEFLSNWLYGKAGNNPNGEKADVIEGLDSNDQIKIIGVATSDLTFRGGASAHGVSGIGIYAKGALEAVYTGGDLSVAQITAMTSGDGSAAALANQITSYGWAG